jgi:hypothetical protein
MSRPAASPLQPPCAGRGQGRPHRPESRRGTRPSRRDGDVPERAFRRPGVPALRPAGQGSLPRGRAPSGTVRPGIPELVAPAITSGTRGTRPGPPAGSPGPDPGRSWPAAGHGTGPVSGIPGLHSLTGSGTVLFSWFPAGSAPLSARHLLGTAAPQPQTDLRHPADLPTRFRDTRSGFHDLYPPPFLSFILYYFKKKIYTYYYILILYHIFSESRSWRLISPP